jgi:hypothetical protein
MMKRQTNQPIEKAPAGYGLTELAFAEEAKALDRLPARIRTALAEASIQINAADVLTEYVQAIALGVNRAALEEQILAAIAEADEKMAIEQGTMPGEFWRGRQIAMRAARGDTALAKPVRQMGRPSAPRTARSLLRGPGSY